jgi:hypothetical protein
MRKSHLAFIDVDLTLSENSEFTIQLIIVLVFAVTIGAPATHLSTLAFIISKFSFLEYFLFYCNSVRTIICCCYIVGIIIPCYFYFTF